jgi:2-polyprenyl-3-methyl-5-hydroxy-6-metoxy-1,4-benzoquinol methylase
MSFDYQTKATVKTKCAICRTVGDATEIYPAKLTGEILDDKAFSARRFYDKKIHFRMASCNSCGLLRSDPIVDPKTYAELYLNSAFTYEDQVDNLIATYGHYLKKVEKYVPSKGTLLEIGCGNGFFLEEALHQGYAEVWGVEPSDHAIGKASGTVRPHVKQGMFTQSMFVKNMFDCICIFQTLDHFLDPAQVLADALAILKPGGVLLAINHNLNAISAKVLGEKSPIIDIEHTYLYTPKTARVLFQKTGFEVLQILPSCSHHSLGYLFSLLPVQPIKLKKLLHSLLEVTRLARVPLLVPIGNIAIIARRSP